MGIGVEKNIEEAVRLYRIASESKFAVAISNMGCCYENGIGVEQDEQEALRLYREAAEQGYAEAIFGVGYCYSNGIGIEQNFDEAVSWYRRAAAFNNSGALNNLGSCYRDGQGVPASWSESVKYYRLAVSNEGNSNVLINLAIAHRDAAQPNLAMAAILLALAESGYRLDLTEKDAALAELIYDVDAEASNEARIDALDWLCSQHYTEVELLVSAFTQ
jgi:TPR repeat protein